MAKCWLENSTVDQRVAIHQEWQKLHKLRVDKDVIFSARIIFDSDTLPKVKMCFVAGMCVCQKPKLRALVQRTQGWLRRKAKKGSQMRQVLEKKHALPQASVA